jgi:endonuclease/exonuclease/phosphatase family metal-dependent hydrolase
VIKAVDAVIQLLIEVEDRPTMERFNELVLSNELHMSPYEHSILVDGRDERGIDIGLFSRFPIRSVRPHYNDTDAEGVIFSRDCPEYEVILPDGKSLIILGNHLKSKGYGVASENNKKRRRQAVRVSEIYREACQRSDLVIVAGDFNEKPDNPSLKPLLQDTDLRDVMTHPSYEGLPGTFDTCTEDDKFDYVLLSPALWGRVKQVGAERSGIYAPRALKKAGITIMPTVTSDENSASDHAAVWVDLEL